MNDRADDARWYVVHTAVRGEWLAHKALRAAAFETLYLHYRATVCHARRKIGVLRPLFPRYLFVAVGPGRSLYEVNTTPGVATVLHVGGVPLEIAVEIIDLLRKRADEHGRTGAPRVRELVRPRFAPGAAVRIVEGPLMDLRGIIEVDRGTEARVWLDDFRRVIQATVPTSALVAFHP